LGWKKTKAASVSILPQFLFYRTARNARPDLSWVKNEKWNVLTAEEKEKFPVLCPDFVVRTALAFRFARQSAK
jgi:Uma2 family endonuclease